MNESIKKSSELDYIIANYLIFIDTSSLMQSNPNHGFIMKNLIPKMQKYNNDKDDLQKAGIYIIKPVITELQRFVNKEDWKVKRSQKDIKRIDFLARQGLAIVHKLLDMNIAVKGVKAEGGHADQDFIYLFTKYSIKHKMCLITQDTNLAQDILAIGSKKSVESWAWKPIKVIGVDGFNYRGYKKSDPTKFRDTPYVKPKTIRPFKIVDKDGNPLKPIIESNTLATSSIPCSGDYVFDNVGKKTKIQEKIASGGEGIIYKMPSSNICKIYKNGLMNDLRFEKLKLMQKKQIYIPGVIWPKTILYNKDKQPVGYLMKQVKNKDGEQITDMQRIFVRPLQNKYFPNLTRLYLVEICLQNLYKFEKLHKYNIIVGDINPSNILIDSNIKTSFIDTDSYQIEQFPCPVGQGHFTAPENQGKNYNEFLRTKDDERFAIATLLFMTLMPGKSPYSHKGGTTPLENIKKRNFSYPFRVEGEEYRDYNKQAPKGPWRFIWSHIPYYIKKAFYNNFKLGDYISVQEWIVLLKKYKKAILIGHSSNEIYPNEYKVVDDDIKNKYK